MVRIWSEGSLSSRSSDRKCEMKDVLIINPKASKGVRRFAEKKILEELSALDHQRWIRDKEKEGYHPGLPDPEMKTLPEMIPYEELEEPVREQIRLRVRQIPENLKGIGFELYRKSF